jgi:hypothetical protein
LSVEEASVRGTYVRGLRRVDVLALDAFEGEVCVFIIIGIQGGVLGTGSKWD